LRSAGVPVEGEMVETIQILPLVADLRRGNEMAYHAAVVLAVMPVSCRRGCRGTGGDGGGLGAVGWWG
jgi:hypothetical protein